MIIDCISDLHGHYPKLEGGDLLIVAGDLTATDTYEQHQEFREWIQEQKYKQKIFIAGNHDNYLTKSHPYPFGVNFPNGTYICDSETEFEGLKIWGSPWTLAFKGMNPKAKAFTCETEEELADKWALIPDDTDILVTHAPPYGVLDQVENYLSGKIENCGSKTLFDSIAAIQPKLHIFGHIHENGRKGIRITHKPRIQMSPEIGGIIRLFQHQETVCFNVSHVNEHYKPVNKSIRIEL